MTREMNGVLIFQWIVGISIAIGIVAMVLVPTERTISQHAGVMLVFTLGSLISPPVWLLALLGETLVTAQRKKGAGPLRPRP